MLVRILIALGALLVVLAVIVAMQPDDFRVTRTTTIAAPAADVFAQVNDFHKWEAWSPWAKLDPNAKNAFEGPESGVGAVMSWAGNSEVGVGKMTITESVPYERIIIRLDFEKPFANTSTAEFTFKEGDHHSVVTWSMYGKNNFAAKAMSLMMNCEKMVGGYFEQGLANLKSLVESNRE